MRAQNQTPELAVNINAAQKDPRKSYARLGKRKIYRGHVEGVNYKSSSAELMQNSGVVGQCRQRAEHGHSLGEYDALVQRGHQDEYQRG